MELSTYLSITTFELKALSTCNAWTFYGLKQIKRCLGPRARKAEAVPAPSSPSDPDVPLNHFPTAARAKGKKISKSAPKPWERLPFDIQSTQKKSPGGCLPTSKLSTHLQTMLRGWSGTKDRSERDLEECSSFPRLLALRQSRSPGAVIKQLSPSQPVTRVRFSVPNNATCNSVL